MIETWITTHIISWNSSLEWPWIGFYINLSLNDHVMGICFLRTLYIRWTWSRNLRKHKNYWIFLANAWRSGLASVPVSSPTRIYLLKVNKRNSRTRCKICSKLTIKTPERCQWRISYLVLGLLLLTLNM